MPNDHDVEATKRAARQLLEARIDSIEVLTVARIARDTAQAQADRAAQEYASAYEDARQRGWGKDELKKIGSFEDGAQRPRSRSRARSRSANGAQPRVTPAPAERTAVDGHDSDGDAQ